jgi:hypothetical protein
MLHHSRALFSAPALPFYPSAFIASAILQAPTGLILFHTAPSSLDFL